MCWTWFILNCISPPTSFSALIWPQNYEYEKYYLAGRRAERWLQMWVKLKKKIVKIPNFLTRCQRKFIWKWLKMKNKRYLIFCKNLLYRTKFQMSSFSSIARSLDHNSLPLFLLSWLAFFWLTTLPPHGGQRRRLWQFFVPEADAGCCRIYFSHSRATHRERPSSLFCGQPQNVSLGRWFRTFAETFQKVLTSQGIASSRGGIQKRPKDMRILRNYEVEPPASLHLRLGTRPASRPVISKARYIERVRPGGKLCVQPNQIPGPTDTWSVVIYG